jgi:hypothetical protein
LKDPQIPEFLNPRIPKWLIFDKFEGSRITPPDAGRARGDAAEITFKRKPCLSFNEKGLFRTGSATDKAHIIGLPSDHHVMFGRTSCIHKGPSNSGEIGGPLMVDPDARPSGIGHSRHMIKGTGYFTVPATCTFSMVNLNLRHPCPP